MRWNRRVAKIFIFNHKPVCISLITGYSIDGSRSDLLLLIVKLAVIVRLTTINQTSYFEPLFLIKKALSYHTSSFT